MNDDETFTINLDSISSNTGTYSITDSTLSIGDITFNTSSTDSITIGTILLMVLQSLSTTL